MPATSDRRYEHIRNDVAESRRILESLVPDMLARNALASFVADTIATAHRLSSASWGISLFPHRICVNVGRGAVIQAFRDGARLIVTGRLLKKLSRPDQRLLEHTHNYSFVPDAYEGYLEVSAFERLPVFAPAHADLVERAARNRRRCFWPYAHSPSVPAVLREYGHSIADPEFTAGSEDTIAEPMDIDATD